MTQRQEPGRVQNICNVHPCNPAAVVQSSASVGVEWRRRSCMGGVRGRTRRGQPQSLSFHHPEECFLSVAFRVLEEKLQGTGSFFILRYIHTVLLYMPTTHWGVKSPVCQLISLVVNSTDSQERIILRGPMSDSPFRFEDHQVGLNIRNPFRTGGKDWSKQRVKTIFHKCEKCIVWKNLSIPFYSCTYVFKLLQIKLDTLAL